MYLKCFLSISLATVETKMQRKIYLFNEGVQSKNVKLRSLLTKGSAKGKKSRLNGKEHTIR